MYQPSSGRLKPRVVEILASLTKSSFARASLQRSFSYFQALILLSLCAVLEKRGTPSNTTNEITQCIADAGEEDRKRFRRGAIWINRLMRLMLGTPASLYGVRHARPKICMNPAKITKLRCARRIISARSISYLPTSAISSEQITLVTDRFRLRFSSRLLRRIRLVIAEYIVIYSRDTGCFGAVFIMLILLLLQQNIIAKGTVLDHKHSCD